MWLRRGHGVEASDELAVLKAELELRREENASFKIERERLPDAGEIVGRLRDVTLATSEFGAEGDDAWHVLTEALVMQKALVDVCQQIERAMITLQSRLQSIGPAQEAALQGSGGQPWPDLLQAHIDGVPPKLRAVGVGGLSPAPPTDE